MVSKDFQKKSLIGILGLDSLPIDGQAEVVDVATDVIEMRCLNVVLEMLDKKEKKVFISMLDKKDEDGVKHLLEDKGIRLMDVLGDEVLRFKREMADRVS